jgi:hypothetical protein
MRTGIKALELPVRLFVMRAIALGWVSVLVFFVICMSCHKSGDDQTVSRSAVSDDDTRDDDSQQTDFAGCLQAFDYIISQCGAQFYTCYGDPMTQNDLIEACGLPKASCVVECYGTGTECESLKTCMKQTCAL